MIKNGEGSDIINLLTAFSEVMYENPDWENVKDTSNLKSNVNKYVYDI